MADALINYSRADRRVAEKIVAALTSQGLSVWWDADLQAGATFVEAIESAMQSAGCIITVWSTNSVASTWVRAEAEWALRRGTLLPIVIGPAVSVPPSFLSVQTKFLSEHDLDRDDWLVHLGQDVRRLAQAKVPQADAALPSPLAIPGVDGAQWKEIKGIVGDGEVPRARKKAFISYADEDEEIAIDLVSHLESSACPCWISFRDVDPGDDYRTAITRAMDQIRFLVLVYSEHVNTSFDIATELILARRRARKRLVLKMDGTEPAGPVEYELATVQWIDCRSDRRAGFERVSRRAALL